MSAHRCLLRRAICILPRTARAESPIGNNNDQKILEGAHVNYFSAGEAGEGSLRVERAAALRSFEVASGVMLKPMLGEQMNINVVELSPNADTGVHVHDEEQMGYVVRGSLEFTDGNERWTLAPGDTYHALPRVPHGAIAGPDGATVVDAFTPPRAGVREMLES
jgi:quercetin dioxygenase-like cupin family protein